MRLLDDVHLIESEVLAPPIASTFERSITKLASYEHSDLGLSSMIVHGSMIGSHCWKKTVEQFLWRDSLRSRSRVRTPLSGTLQC